MGTRMLLCLSFTDFVAFHTVSRITRYWGFLHLAHQAKCIFDLASIVSCRPCSLRHQHDGPLPVPTDAAAATAGPAAAAGRLDPSGPETSAVSQAPFPYPTFRTPPTMQLQNFLDGPLALPHGTAAQIVRTGHEAPTQTGGTAKRWGRAGGNTKAAGKVVVEAEPQKGGRRAPNWTDHETLWVRPRAVDPFHISHRANFIKEQFELPVLTGRVDSVKSLSN